MSVNAMPSASRQKRVIAERLGDGPPALSGWLGTAQHRYRKGAVVMAGTSVRGLDALGEALTGEAQHLAGVMRTIEEVTPRAVGVWSVGETIAHVAGGPAHALTVIRGEVTPVPMDDVAGHNAAELAGDPERDPRVLVGRLEAGTRELVAYARTVDGDPSVTAFTDVRVPLSAVLGLILAEVLVHGFDIARATRRPWVVDPDAAALAVITQRAFMPFSLRPEAADLRLAVDLRIRRTDPVVVTVGEGTVRIEPPNDQAVDFHYSADAWAHLLIGFHRVPVWQPFLRGQVAIWGRRIWRVNDFAGAFKSF